MTSSELKNTDFSPVDYAIGSPQFIYFVWCPVNLTDVFATTPLLFSRPTEAQVSGIPGVSVLVINQGEIVHSNNFGFSNLAENILVTSDTIFHIASMTKSFTIACINRLRVEGKLTLDNTIQDILPEAQSRDPVVAQFGTVADLLGHRTGFYKVDSIWLGAEGELMFKQEQATAVFNQLRSVQSVRSKFMYNNIYFAMLGEIIAKLSGMTRSITTKVNSLPDNTSLTYNAFSDATPFNVPLPGSSASGALGASGSLMSTSNDLSKYYKALMKCWTAQTNHKERASHIAENLLFDDVSWLFTPLQIMDLPTAREKSYAGGWARSQLPGTHQSSLVGDTSFVMLLPEAESAVVVLTNSMALNDAADWIGQLLVEKLLDSPIRNDYARLASLSAKRAIKKYEELTNKLEAGKDLSNPPKDLAKYAGSYVGFGGVFLIDIAVVKDSLELRWQGRKSQALPLHHYREDVFSWFLTFDDQIKHGLFPAYRPQYYLMSFKSEDEKGFKILNWVHDGDVVEGENFYRLGDSQSRVSGISL
ncbi:beta-lactamase/transpeptidase-like protein [Mollisia scopiformis]|uniref:Beta-lactamase/transpeptidase-like protein n=1 Tax=Mollisia scopiformis TaxID=149040 RepID=A0A132B3Q2_MOLSC|nr:beta-lactamase/transpeptidase-like protein [Mollisia scopiformis]KUJ07020.1 beta-lactamase/transpeptidase-like protein [Mollisia scopiformis]